MSATATIDASTKPKKPRAPRKPKALSAAIAHVHETLEPIASVELSPPHPPREETPEYAAAHKFIVYEKKAPCEVCGVTIDTLDDPKSNLFGAKALETHHFPIERSLADACDPVKVHRDFPTVYDRTTLMAFVDSPANLKCLCDIHHRSLEHGIHHLLPADFAVQKYLLDGYLVAAAPKDAAAALAQDEEVEQAAGIEQAVDVGLARGPARGDPSTPLGAAIAGAPAKPARKRALRHTPVTAKATATR